MIFTDILYWPKYGILAVYKELKKFKEDVLSRPDAKQYIENKTKENKKAFKYLENSKLTNWQQSGFGWAG